MVVGDAAKAQTYRNASNTVFGGKRLMGRKFSDASVQADMKHWPFKVVSGLGGTPIIEAKAKGEIRQLEAKDISEILLVKIKRSAEAHLRVKVTHAVIAVPAHFNLSQRQATIDAGTRAGLNVCGIISEPLAAAMAYGFDQGGAKQNVLIFDLGGGKLDVSLVDIEEEFVEVKATAGNPHLGGEDFDNRLVDYFLAEFIRRHGKDMSSNQRSMCRLRTACESAKCTLSVANKAHITIDSLLDGIDFQSTITRARFEELCMDHFQNSIACCETVLRDAGISKNQVEEVVLVGASTRIPRIQAMLSTFFNGKNLCRSMNPDEAAAYGATLHAVIRAGYANTVPRLEELVTSEVTPFSLGIQTAENVMSIIIPRHKPFPSNKMTCTFKTTVDNQGSAFIPVYEGECSRARENQLYRVFRLDGISQKPRGQVRIQVAFEIDHKGLLKVSAHERSSAKTSLTLVVGHEDTKVVPPESLLSEVHATYQPPSQASDPSSVCGAMPTATGATPRAAGPTPRATGPMPRANGFIPRERGPIARGVAYVRGLLKVHAVQHLLKEVATHLLRHGLLELIKQF